MQIKFLVLLLLVASISLASTASAHKSSIIGDYKIEVGWDKEPPIAGMENKITILITSASDEDKKASEEMMKEMEGMTNDEMADMDHDEVEHDEMEHEDHDEMEHGHDKGISGLTSSFDITITLNGEKTTLTMVEDEEMHGLYLGEFTPSASGFPIVHFFAEVDGESLELDFHPEKVEDGTVIKTATSDGTVNVDVITTVPTADKDMLIKVEFTDAQGNPIEHVNYDIIAIQDGSQVLSENSAHAHDGDSEHSTEALSSDDPVEIQVTILGIGLPDDEANWSGPMGETISLNVVPEFGPIAMIVLAVATLSVVAMAAKSKIIPKL